MSDNSRRSMASRSNNLYHHVPLPSITDAYEVLARLYGAEANSVWAKLLTAAGLNGHETNAEALDRLVAATRQSDPVISLFGRSLAIRAATHRRLNAAHDILRCA